MLNPKNLDTIFLGLQTLAALIVAMIGAWAAFFTNLPETLEIQLRSELSSLNEEMIDARRTLRGYEEEKVIAENKIKQINEESTRLSFELSEAQKTLSAQATKITETEATGRELEHTIRNLREETAQLHDLKQKLSLEVEKLAGERAEYAKATSKSVLAEMAKFASFRLEVSRHLANIAVNYGEHRIWLVKARKQAEMKNAYNALSQKDMGDPTNPVAKAYFANITRPSLPEFWLGYPTDIEEAEKHPGLFGSSDILSIIWDHEASPDETHSRLIGWYFHRVLRAHGARKVTPRIFVENLLAHKATSSLQISERKEIESSMFSMVGECAVNQEEQINIFFEQEPTAQEIIELGEQVTSPLMAFSKCIQTHFERQGILFPSYH